jgi:RNA polymerase sigma-70 factor (ECF subfamily)
MNEAELAEGCRRGDPDSIRELAEVFYDKVFRVAFTLTHDRHQAEDLTQETFTASLKSIERFRGESGLFTWLVGILRRIRLNRQRTETRLKVVADVQDGPAPSEDADKRHAREELRAAMAKMDDESRLILSLYHVEGMKYDEIAQAMQTPIGTVKSRLHEARRRLKNLIEGSHAV